MASSRCFWSKGSSEWCSSRTRPPRPGLQFRLAVSGTGECPRPRMAQGIGRAPPARGWWRDACARGARPRAGAPSACSRSKLPTSPMGEAEDSPAAAAAAPGGPLQDRCPAAKTSGGQPRRQELTGRELQRPVQVSFTPAGLGLRDGVSPAKVTQRRRGGSARGCAGPAPAAEGAGPAPARRRHPGPAPLASPHPAPLISPLTSPRVPLTSPRITSPRAAARASNASRPAAPLDTSSPPAPPPAPPLARSHGRGGAGEAESHPHAMRLRLPHRPRASPAPAMWRRIYGSERPRPRPPGAPPPSQQPILCGRALEASALLQPLRTSRPAPAVSWAGSLAVTACRASLWQALCGLEQVTEPLSAVVSKSISRVVTSSCRELARLKCMVLSEVPDASSALPSWFLLFFFFFLVGVKIHMTYCL